MNHRQTPRRHPAQPNNIRNIDDELQVAEEQKNNI
jgi:hypothetical protein